MHLYEHVSNVYTPLVKTSDINTYDDVAINHKCWFEISRDSNLCIYFSCSDHLYEGFIEINLINLI